MTPGRRLAAGVAALALLAGCAGPGARGAEPNAAPTTTTPAGGRAAGGAAGEQPGSGAEAARGFRSARGYRATPAPVRLEIPKIGVAGSLGRLGRAPNGTVEEPSGFDQAGWYAPGPRPGDPGSAVILGHVDSKHSGPAVFFRLRELRRGDRIDVTRADGSRVRFVVQRTAQYDKQAFPTDEVYYPTLAPALRLVTCGGRFDHASGHHVANVIVFATIAG
jgi:hypothetical protein